MHEYLSLLFLGGLAMNMSIIFRSQRLNLFVEFLSKTFLLSLELLFLTSMTNPKLIKYFLILGPQWMKCDERQLLNRLNNKRLAIQKTSFPARLTTQLRSLTICHPLAKLILPQNRPLTAMFENSLNACFFEMPVIN